MQWRGNAPAGGRVFACGGTRPGVPDEVSRLRHAFLAALVVVLLGAATAASVATTHTGLFGTTELPSASLKAFPKWRDTLARVARERRSCTADRCRLGEWNRLLGELRGSKEMTRLALLNRAINRHRYVEDAVNWQRADYWETPLQFLDRSGDCEDFAIAKYLALRELGMSASDMRIVVVRDQARYVMHAVLVVYVEDRALILDNLRDKIVSAELIRNYEPIYSLNEQGWWLRRR